MTWMLTATGAAIDLRFMPPAQISLLDIAHHLARLDRFAGACSRPYSVAEHSLLVCDILANELHVHSPRPSLPPCCTTPTRPTAAISPSP